MPRCTSRAWIALVTPIVLVVIFILRAHQYLSGVRNRKLYIQKNAQTQAANIMRYSEDNNPQSNKTVDLLIFSYMGSGSTLIGNLLAARAGSFYTSEPLTPLAPYQYITESELCQIRYKNCSKAPGTRQPEAAMNAIIDTHSCNFRYMDVNIIRHIIVENKSTGAWEQFAKCISGYSPNSVTHVQNITHRHEGTGTRQVATMKCESVNERTNAGVCRCYKSLTQICMSSKLRLTKVLRLSMSMILPILVRLPHLKVLFLSRDPRGIVNSRMNADWFPVYENDTSGVTDSVDSLCYKMEEDLGVLGNIRQIFPKRVLGVQVEHLVRDTESNLRRIFDFMDMSVPDHTRTATLAHELRSPHYANLSTTKWKQQLNSTFRDIVESRCANVIHMLGYNLK